jgi:hypothetical protein
MRIAAVYGSEDGDRKTLIHPFIVDQRGPRPSGSNREIHGTAPSTNIRIGLYSGFKLGEPIGQGFGVHQVLHRFTVARARPLTDVAVYNLTRHRSSRESSMGTAANPKPALVLRLACAVLSLTSAISAEQLPIKIYTIADGHFLTTDVTQIARLEAVVQRLGGEVVYVKPHGALYNVAVKNKVVAQAIAQGVARWNPQAPIFGLAGSPMLDVWRGMDRRYETDGTLRSRKFPDALITEPQEAAAHTRTATPAVMRRVY